MSRLNRFGLALMLTSIWVLQLKPAPGMEGFQQLSGVLLGASGFSLLATEGPEEPK